MPNNIIMIGPTGVGKTEIARRLAKLANAPFIKVEASKFTEVGYVGRDVESIIRDLTEYAVTMVKAERRQRSTTRPKSMAKSACWICSCPPRANSARRASRRPRAMSRKTRPTTTARARNSASGSEPARLENRMIELDVPAGEQSRSCR